MRRNHKTIKILEYKIYVRGVELDLFFEGTEDNLRLEIKKIFPYHTVF